jgi:DNA mismatch repair protein MutL
VSQGGIQLIQVVDNGCGIHPDDLPLAFASHATSKLATTEDLFQIGTLGFRGEALASIGSIAQVKLQSRQAAQASGAEITCEGGQLSPMTPWNGSPGTRLEVRHLFYNTPARRKFLKAVGPEMGHISEAFSRLALAHLGVHGTVRHNGRLVYEVSPGRGLLDRIGLFFGTELANSLYMVRRWVRDRSLFQAVQEAYRGLLMLFHGSMWKGLSHVVLGGGRTVLSYSSRCSVGLARCASQIRARWIGMREFSGRDLLVDSFIAAGTVIEASSKR